MLDSFLNIDCLWTHYIHVQISSFSIHNQIYFFLFSIIWGLSFPLSPVVRWMLVKSLVLVTLRTEDRIALIIVLGWCVHVCCHTVKITVFVRILRRTNVYRDHWFLALFIFWTIKCPCNYPLINWLLSDYRSKRRPYSKVVLNFK